MGIFAKVQKKYRCFGSGWSSKACAGTERVWMLTEKAENFTDYFWKMLNHARFLRPDARNIRAPVGQGLYLAVQ